MLKKVLIRWWCDSQTVKVGKYLQSHRALSRDVMTLDLEVLSQCKI